MTIEQVNQPDTAIRGEDTSPVVFFETVYRAFQQAEQIAAGSLDRFYSIGGYTIRLRFAGPALVPRITPALEHLATKPSSSPMLTICLWDSASTRAQMPPPPWSAEAYIARGEVRGYNDGRIHTSFHIGANVLNMLDTRLDLAVLWICDASQIPYYESSAPLRTILHWWMCNHGRQVVHAGAVGTSMGGVLLAGKGGSGKSTTALACLNSELVYVSDDYCLLATDSVPYAYSLYSSAKLNAEDVERFPRLASAVSNPKRLGTEKAVFLLHKHYREKIATGFPIRAILLPRVTGRSETSLKEISSAASLKALAASTIFQLPGAGHKDFQRITKFVKQMPSYILELGYDISRIPDAIMGLLSAC